MTIIKALIALVGQLSLSVGWENSPEREQDCFVLPITSCNLRKQYRSGSALFVNVPAQSQVLPFPVFSESESESEYFTSDTSIDIHSPGPTIAKTSL